MSASISLTKISALLLAGGRGSRMQSSIPKQYLSLRGKLLVRYSFETLLRIPQISEVIVVCEPEYQDIFSHETSLFAPQGKRRQDSVYHGLQKVKNPWTLVHDAARPFLKERDVVNLIEKGSAYDASALAVPERNTLKRIDKERNVIETIPREGVWEVQTPQLVKTALLQEGLELALKQGITLTDDLSALELLGKIPHLIEGSPSNIKVTYPDDLWIESVIN